MQSVKPFTLGYRCRRLDDAHDGHVHASVHALFTLERHQ